VKREMAPQIYKPKNFEDEVIRIQKFKETWHYGKKKYVDGNGNFFEIDWESEHIFIN
jgi:hypothetical protein